MGPKGSQSDANLALMRRFGSGIFRDWEAFKPPLVARREALLADRPVPVVPEPAAEIPPPRTRRPGMKDKLREIIASKEAEWQALVPHAAALRRQALNRNDFRPFRPGLYPGAGSWA